MLGHFKCELDPLRLERPYFSKILESYFEEIRPEQYGFDPKKDVCRCGVAPYVVCCACIVVCCGMECCCGYVPKCV